MKRKLFAILISMLFISMMPSVVGVNTELEKEPCLDVGRIFIKGGFVFFPHYSDGDLIFFVIILSFIEITPTERNWRCLGPRWIRLENFIGNIWIGPFGILGYVFGTCMGGIEIK